MMQTPTEFELQELLHRAIGYDPAKAHEYYERTKKLKGRKRGSTPTRKPTSAKGLASPKGLVPKGFAKTNKERHEAALPKQRRELAQRIQNLEGKLRKLETRIREMAREDAAENRKSKAKKERAAKEADKPKTAAEKAEAARESDKYRDKHKQELKSKAKKADGKSGGGTSGAEKKARANPETIRKLETLATKVRGQIAVAKQKLAAL